LDLYNCHCRLQPRIAVTAKCIPPQNSMLLVSGALPAAIFYDRRCMGGCSHLCSAVRHPQIQPPACGLRRRRGALRARCSATCASPACAPTAVSALGEEGVCYCWGGRWWWLLGRTAAAAAPHGFGGDCCWLLWALCFLGEKEGVGGVSQKSQRLQRARAGGPTEAHRGVSQNAQRS
jgi:hypothetical protein